LNWLKDCFDFEAQSGKWTYAGTLCDALSCIAYSYSLLWFCEPAGQATRYYRARAGHGRTGSSGYAGFRAPGHCDYVRTGKTPAKGPAQPARIGDALADSGGL